jgi:hypothetical protein
VDLQCLTAARRRTRLAWRRLARRAPALVPSASDVEIRQRDRATVQTPTPSPATTTRSWRCSALRAHLLQPSCTIAHRAPS